MEVLDSDGRLLGYVNVVDAVVILLLLAVTGAGVSIVAGSGSSPTGPVAAGADNYVTLSVEPLSEDLSAELVGATNLTAGHRRLRITDAYRTIHPDRDAVVTVLRAQTSAAPESFPATEPVTLEGDRFRYRANVTGFSDSPGLPVANRTVTLRTTVGSAIGTEVQTGDATTIGGESVATVQSITRVSAGSDRELLVEMEVRTIETDRGHTYAGRRLRLGTQLPFRTDQYALRGHVVGLSSESVASERVTTVVEATVPRSVARSVHRGDEFRIGDQRLARIESVRALPTTNATTRRLRLRTTLETVARDGQHRFLGRPVTVGAAVPFRTAAYEFTGTIVHRGRTRNERPVNATLRVAWNGVSPAQADALEPGMTERHRGANARIIDVHSEPSTVVLQTQEGEIYAREHPTNRDVTLTVAVRARAQGTSLTFHGRTVQTGSPVVFDFGTVTVRGTIVDIRSEE